LGLLSKFWRFDIVFLITGNADTIYNIRNRNEMTDQNRKLSGNTANFPNRKEIDNNRKGRQVWFDAQSYVNSYTVVPPLYGPCNQCLSPLKLSSNPTHDEVFSIQHYVIKPVKDFLQVGGFLWVLRFRPTIKLTTTV
jgi:hypothetical protein